MLTGKTEVTDVLDDKSNSCYVTDNWLKFYRAWALQMSIKHIAIPFDEIQLFKEEDKYQNYLVETLIYSTKITLHSNNNKSKCILVLTKNNLWLEDEPKPKKKMRIPIVSITEIIKAEEHPEMVILTEEAYDNLRMSTTNNERCQNIISAIAFYFTYLAIIKRPLQVYSLKQNSLLYFERTVKEKKNGPRFSLERYDSTLVKYVECKDTPDLFGKLIIQKMLLVKQLYVQNSHLVHIAKINQNEYYICHTVDKTQNICQAITQHTNLPFVQTLMYARHLEYKVQIFFQFSTAVKSHKISLPQLFEQIYRLYDQLKQVDKDGLLTPDMLCECPTAELPPKEVPPTGNLPPSVELKSISKIILRQFRYDFLLFQKGYNKLIYRKIYSEQTPQDALTNKLYNLGLILYEFLFGRPLFDHEDLDIIIYLKQNLTAVPFSSHLNIPLTKSTKHFIQSCILGSFNSVQQLTHHPWIRQSGIQL